MEKYGSVDSWKIMTEVYEVLPLAAKIDNRIFACHGGLSPDFAKMDDILMLKKTPNVPYDGALCDLLWSDPNPDESGKEWEVSPRGAGYYFGIEITRKFLYENNLKKIVRAHQMVDRVSKFLKLKTRGIITHMIRSALQFSQLQIIV